MSSTEGIVRRAAGTVEENPLRIDQGNAEQVIDALNTDLAAGYVLYHQLKKHHWNVAGAEHRDLHLFLGDAAGEIEVAVDHLAERVQALGGVPVSGPAGIESASPITFEGEDVLDVRTSLANDLEAMGEIIERYREHVELASNLGDHATAHLLREQLLDVEELAHTVDHYLEDDTLVSD